MFFRKKKHHKKIIIPIVFVLVILVAVRLTIEPYLLKKANEQGNTSSSLYTYQLDDIDLSLWRGMVFAENIKFKLTQDQREFLTIKMVDVSLAWREFFRGRLLLDVGVDRLNLKLAKDLINSIDAFKKDAVNQEVKLPIKIVRVSVTNSQIIMLDYPGLKNQEHLTIHDINADFRNILPSKKEPLASFDVSASISEHDDVKIKGKFNPIVQPKSWDLEAVVKNFVLSDANKLLKDKIPMTFKKGTLDLYVEAKSTQNKIRGYVKPFLHNVQMTGNKKDFKGVKHLFVDVLTEVSSDILENEKTDTVATKVPFTYDHGLKLDSKEALDKVIQNGFHQKLKPGIENEFKL